MYVTWQQYRVLVYLIPTLSTVVGGLILLVCVGGSVPGPDHTPTDTEQLAKYVPACPYSQFLFTVLRLIIALEWYTNCHNSSDACCVAFLAFP